MRKMYFILMLAILAMAPQYGVAQKAQEIKIGCSVDNMVVLYNNASAWVELVDQPNIKENNWIQNPITNPLDSKAKKHFEDSPSSGILLLVEENGQTILHCSYYTTSKNMKGLWLGGDETYIVDVDTGTRYKARGSYDPKLWGQTFGVKAPKGTMLDFPIFFPALPKSVRRIKIYGVPKWGLRGNEVINIYRRSMSPDGYDTIPNLRVPKLSQPAHNYNKDDMGTYAIYTDAHLLAPIPEHTMAMWRTPDATYLAIAYELNWNQEYFGIQKGTVLVDDNTGKQYKLRETQGLPLGPLFFIRGVAGDMVAFVKVFEPLPLTTTSVSYHEPDGEPFHVWGASWRGEHYLNLSVSELRENQKKFNYYERVIVE